MRQDFLIGAVAAFALVYSVRAGAQPTNAFQAAGNASERGAAIEASGARGARSVTGPSVRSSTGSTSTESTLSGRLRVLDPFTGELRDVRPTDVLIIQDGELVRRVKTNGDGVATIEDLASGAYSAVAIGPDGIAAFGFEAVDGSRNQTGENPYRFDALLIPRTDVGAAQQSLCQGDDPIVVPVPSQASVVAPVAEAPRPVPTSTRFGAGEDVGPVSPQYLRPRIDLSTTKHVSALLEGQPILIRDGKTGLGRIVILEAGDGRGEGLADAHLAFIRNGKVLGRVTTDHNGYCGVLGLEDGVYSMVGVGENGFIALGIRVETRTAAQHPTAKAFGPAAKAHGRDGVAGSRYVSSRHVHARRQNGYGAPSLGWQVSGACSGALPFAPGFVCGGCGQVGCCGNCGVGVGLAGGPCGPVAGGYGYGMGCGGFGGVGFGGGGFGGGGMMWGLLGAAGLGTGIAALVSDNNPDNNAQSQPPQRRRRAPRRRRRPVRPRPPASPSIPPAP